MLRPDRRASVALNRAATTLATLSVRSRPVATLGGDEREAEMSAASESSGRVFAAGVPRRRPNDDEQRRRLQAAGSHGTGFVIPPGEEFVQAPGGHRRYVDVGRERDAGREREERQRTALPVTSGATRSPASALLIAAYVLVIAIAVVVIWVVYSGLVSF